MLKRPTTCKLCLERLGGYFDRIPTDLYNSTVWSCATSQEQGGADDSIISGKGHLSGGTIVHRIETRHNTSGRKVDIVQQAT
jgi:hypothetical protein